MVTHNKIRLQRKSFANGFELHVWSFITKCEDQKKTVFLNPLAEEKLRIFLIVHHMEFYLQVRSSYKDTHTFCSKNTQKVRVFFLQREMLVIYHSLHQWTSYQVTQAFQVYCKKCVAKNGIR